MIKKIGSTTDQVFPIKSILWVNPNTNEVAVRLGVPEGREILKVSKENVAKIVGKMDYVTGGGYFISTENVNRIFRVFIGTNIGYNVVFEGVHTNDNIMISQDEYDKVIEKFIVI